MEEKNSKQKKRTGLSFLALAFIIAIISIFIFYVIPGDSEKYPATVQVDNYIVSALGAIYDYLNYVEQTEITVPGIYEYTSISLKLLSGALTELAHFEDIKATAIVSKRNHLLTKSDYILINQEAEHVNDSIKDAFLIASEIIVHIQEENFPKLSSLALNVIAIAELFNRNEPLTEQQEQIQLFFKEAAQIIKTMALIRSN